jgi:prevent-host-death family protein
MATVLLPLQLGEAMRYSVSKLRADLFRVLDRVLETGIPVEIERKGKILKIIPAEKPDILANFKEHPEYLNCDPESLVHMDWSEECKS